MTKAQSVAFIARPLAWTVMTEVPAPVTVAGVYAVPVPFTFSDIPRSLAVTGANIGSTKFSCTPLAVKPTIAGSGPKPSLISSTFAPAVLPSVTEARRPAAVSPGCAIRTTMSGISALPASGSVPMSW